MWGLLACLGGTMCAVFLLGRLCTSSPTFLPEWKMLLRHSFIACCWAAWTFWLVHFGFLAFKQILTAAGVLQVPSVQVSWPHLEPSLLLSGMLILCLYIAFSVLMAAALGCPAAIMSYVVLQNFNALGLVQLVTLGAVCGAVALWSLGDFPAINESVAPVAGSLAGATGAYVFAPALRQQDRARGCLR
jgi:hypothetical protein